ncbi:MAG: GTPase-associated system all-helical protein GASH [Polyangiaceae bacterium]
MQNRIAAAVCPDAAWHEKRRVGIEALVKQLTVQDVETLVRLALKTRHQPSTDGVSRTRQPFKAADETFHSASNDRELQVICGATLAELFRRHGNISSVAAIAVSTATSLGVNKPELPFDLAEAADAGIQRQAELHRRRPDLSKLPPVAFPKGEFDKATQKFQSQADLNNIVPTLTILIDASKAAFDAVLKRCSDGLTAVGSFVAIQDEELEMLWWLVGDRSIDLDRAFGKIDREERPLVVAKELAQMTLYLPGPPAIRSLLGRSGLKDSEKLAVPACVNACDVDWLRPLVDATEPSPVTRPLHLAIKRKLETSDDDSWVAGWSAVTGVGAEQKFSALHIGTQFYRERLLARWAPA